MEQRDRYQQPCVTNKQANTPVNRNVFFYIVCTVPCIEEDYQFYVTNFTGTKTYTHQTLVNHVHVSARHRCHHQGVLSVAYGLPDEGTYDMPKHVEELLTSDVYIFWCM